MQNYLNFLGQLLKVNSSLNFLAETFEKEAPTKKVNKETEKFFTIMNTLKTEIITLNEYFDDYKEASLQSLILTKQVHQVLNYYYEPLKDIDMDFLKDENNRHEIRRVMNKIKYVRSAGLLSISIKLPQELRIGKDFEKESVNVIKIFKLFKGLLDREELLGILEMVNSNIDRISRYLTSKIGASNPLAYLRGAIKNFDTPMQNSIIFLKDMSDKDYDKLRKMLPVIETALKKLQDSEATFRKFHKAVVKHINIALVDLNRTTSSLSHKLMEIIPRATEDKEGTILTEEDIDVLHSILETEVKGTRKKKLRDIPIDILKVASFKFLTSLL